MKNSFLGEIVISLVLIVLLILIINPLNFWMPNQAHMMMVIALGVLFMIFASFVWREKTTDERDNLHRSIASRFAYVTGTGLLVIAIIVQILTHTLDMWIVVVLGTMILAKIIGLWYAKIKH